MKNRGLIYQAWFQVLGLSLVLFLVSEQALRITGNRNFAPTVVLLGAFAIPAAVVAYFNSREHKADAKTHTLPQPVLVACFVVGGVLGIVAAGIVEFAVLRTMALPVMFAVGLIEEGAKLIVPLALLLRWHYTSESDGLLFGVSAGMGFAALETAGYGLVALIDSKGNVGAMEQVLLFRGLISPFGHAAWTGLVCAALWRSRARTGALFTWPVVWTFILVVFLHAMWNAGSFFLKDWNLLIAYLLVGGTSSILLYMEMRRAVKSPPSADEPESIALSEVRQGSAVSSLRNPAVREETQRL